MVLGRAVAKGVQQAVSKHSVTQFLCFSLHRLASVVQTKPVQQSATCQRKERDQTFNLNTVRVFNEDGEMKLRVRFGRDN